MKNIILLGDSIFDNKVYVDVNEPDVTEQLNKITDENTKATRLAVDGDVIKSVYSQIEKLPEDATHLFLSVGGNDALSDIYLLNSDVNKVEDAFQLFYEKRAEFENRYSALIDKLINLKLPLTICTIYYPRFDTRSLSRVESYFESDINLRDRNKKLQESAMTALSVYNDVIFKVGIGNDIPIIDLRVLCNDDADFANPIEPSAIGGMKIARKINEVSKLNSYSLNVHV